VVVVRVETDGPQRAVKSEMVHGESLNAGPPQRDPSEGSVNYSSLMGFSLD
jgi:hypothetical protein